MISGLNVCGFVRVIVNLMLIVIGLCVVLVLC